ncbi:hypothetical protein CEXT_551461 [Caerostris extrusa]|uniref:Uncharacterized protein n=1 Tax=Caerostris extrusa TaxID=172846 RepID=A0AAV4P078_CAEEX|nr:hypothetical protein CEXT_551461 [Caerostris extrusa]
MSFDVHFTIRKTYNEIILVFASGHVRLQSAIPLSIFVFGPSGEVMGLSRDISKSFGGSTSEASNVVPYAEKV